MKKPTRLFHATAPSNIPSIMEKGILRSQFGEVYLCETMEDCLRIIGSRIKSRIAGIEEVQVTDPERIAVIKELIETRNLMGTTVREDGTLWQALPVIEKNDHAAIIEVNVAMLHSGSLDYSEDHNPLMFPDLKSYAYWRDIPPTALLHTTVVPLGD